MLRGSRLKSKRVISLLQQTVMKMSEQSDTFKEVYEYIMSIDTYDTNAGTVAAALQKLVEWMKAERSG